MKQLKYLLLILIMGIVSFCVFPSFSYAENEDDGRDGTLLWQAPDTAIWDAMHENQGLLKQKDLNIGGIINWLTRSDSYTLSLKSDNYNGSNDLVYHFINVPSVGKNTMNSLSKMLSQVGYQGVSGQAYKTSASESRTAEQRFGYNLPNATYLGEEPFPVINYNFMAHFDVLGTLWNGAIGAISGFFGGETNGDYEVLSEYKVSDVKSLVYNTLDYPNAGANAYTSKELGQWLKDRFDGTPTKDLAKKLEDGGLTKDMAKTYQSATDGAGWNKTGYGSEAGQLVVRGNKHEMQGQSDYRPTPGSSPGVVIPGQMIQTESYEFPRSFANDEGVFSYSKFEEAGCAKAVNLIGICSFLTRAGESGLEELLFPCRIMPYSISSLGNASALYVGTPDPRAVYWETNNSFFNIFQAIGRGFFNAIAGFTLGTTQSFMELSANMNSVCSFNGIYHMFNDGKKEEEKSDPIVDLWNNPVFDTVVTLLAIIVIIKLVQAVVAGIRGNIAIGKIITMMILALGCAIILMFPAQFVKMTENIADTIINLGTKMDGDALEGLYTNDATPDEITRLRYWGVAMFAWTDFNTGGHAFDSEANKFSMPSSEKDLSIYREYKNFGDGTIKKAGSTEATIDEYPRLKGNQAITKWSVIMLNAEYNHGQSFNTVYRGLDHFLAPRIVTDSTDWYKFDTRTNENFASNPQSSIPVVWAVLAFGIMLCTFMKLLCFIEFVYDIMMLIVKALEAIMTVDNGVDNGLKDTFKATCKALAKVVIWDILIGTAIALSSRNTNQIFLFLLAAVVAILPIRLTTSQIRGEKSSGVFDYLMPSLLRILVELIVKNVSSLNRIRKSAKTKEAILHAKGATHAIAREGKKVGEKFKPKGLRLSKNKQKDNKNLDKKKSQKGKNKLAGLASSIPSVIDNLSSIGSESIGISDDTLKSSASTDAPVEDENTEEKENLENNEEEIHKNGVAAVDENSSKAIKDATQTTSTTNNVEEENKNKTKEKNIKSNNSKPKNSINNKQPTITLKKKQK